MAKSGPYLRSAEAARRLGVSGKALRLYEAEGLVRAERTSAGWRVYGPEQFAQLHKVLALKRFGFPHRRIADLLSGDQPDLATFLMLHEQVLRQESQRLDRALALLADARARLAASGALSTDDLIDLTKETVMTDRPDETLTAVYDAIAAKHFTPDEQATLAANGYGGMDKPSPGWDALHREATELMRVGDPASPAAIDLARRWMGKVFEGTGGDPGLTRKMKAVARETLAEPSFAAASTSSVAMMDFVALAYGAAIAAGVMPKPE